MYDDSTPAHELPAPPLLPPLLPFGPLNLPLRLPVVAQAPHFLGARLSAGGRRQWRVETSLL